MLEISRQSKRFVFLSIFFLSKILIATFSEHKKKVKRLEVQVFTHFYVFFNSTQLYDIDILQVYKALLLQKFKISVRLTQN